MTQEEKELLLVDICGRLSYDVMVNIEGYDTEKLIGIENETITTKATPTSYSDKGEYPIDIVKPYLRPMSSMNKEEEEELRLLKNQLVDCDENNDEKFYHIINEIHNLYLSHHIDFMGLIPKGLAIEVTKENNPYKN